ncbi:MAG: hypothetical protein ABII22_01260 [Candidatus Micrarchaeota archaeon]
MAQAQKNEFEEFNGNVKFMYEEISRRTKGIADPMRWTDVCLQTFHAHKKVLQVDLKNPAIHAQIRNKLKEQGEGTLVSGLNFEKLALSLDMQNGTLFLKHNKDLVLAIYENEKGEISVSSAEKYVIDVSLNISKLIAENKVQELSKKAQDPVYTSFILRAFKKLYPKKYDEYSKLNRENAFAGAYIDNGRAYFYIQAKGTPVNILSIGPDGILGLKPEYSGKLSAVPTLLY